MGKNKNYLSLCLNGDIFFDGTERICRCLKETGLKDGYLSGKSAELAELKDMMYRTLHYKADLELVKEESVLLRSRLAGLKRQVVWWTKFGLPDEKASARRLQRIINAYGALNALELREYRTTADLVLRDLGTETAMADIAALSGMKDLVDQLSDSLETIREKQDSVDTYNSDNRPATLSEIKRSIAAKVNAVMAYVIGNVDANPEAFAKLLNNLETILANANHRNIAVQAAAEAAPAITPAE